MISGYDSWKLAEGSTFDTRKVTDHCGACGDEILEGNDIWRHVDGVTTFCSVTCLAMMDVDIDDFIKTEAEAIY